MLNVVEEVKIVFSNKRFTPWSQRFNLSFGAGSQLVIFLGNWGKSQFRGENNRCNSTLQAFAEASLHVIRQHLRALFFDLSPNPSNPLKPNQKPQSLNCHDGLLCLLDVLCKEKDNVKGVSPMKKDTCSYTRNFFKLPFVLEKLNGAIPAIIDLPFPHHNFTTRKLFSASSKFQQDAQFLGRVLFFLNGGDVSDSISKATKVTFARFLRWTSPDPRCFETEQRAA